ncbi:hypothetical protein Vretimale_9344 [Volvox reticuliferus]|uniref:F-box domain-containing protein n=1 Tax=Volvox reticuliferus TaxID=1737510 RepID=A0A8J4GD50_9CHLO|nr:hypothetical protein Vretimale_9344 [Volvox reticuliferus]
MGEELDSVASLCPGNTEGIQESASTLPLTSLPDGILIRIVQAADPEARRQLRLAARTLRPLVDACSTSLTLSSYSLPCLLSRGRLPDFAPELCSVLLSLQDITAPAGYLAKLPRLSFAQLPRLTSLTLALANDHLLPPAAVVDLAASIPPSTTRLVLTHMLGSSRPATQLPARPSPAAAAAAGQPQLDYAALRHLLCLCPHVREVRLDGGCWVRSSSDLQALVNLTSPSKALAAVEMADVSLNEGAGTFGGPAGADGGHEVVISSIRGMYLDPDDGYLRLPRALGSLSGLAALDVQIVTSMARQVPPPAAAAGAADAADAEDVGGLVAHVAALLDMADWGVASEQLLRGLITPALAGLTRLVVREFQGSTMALLSALEGLPLLAHLGLSGLDDAPYITDTHLELLSRLPSLKHLAVDRLDISQHRDQPEQRQDQQPTDGLFIAAGPYLLGSGGGSCSGSGAILPHLTGLEVALVVHSVQRLSQAFPSVQHLTLRWLWEQAMRKLAGWASLTCLSLSNLDCCLDWGLLRTLTGLTQLQLCRGSSYEQLAELLYLLRALPGLQVLHLNSWHCMRNSEPDRLALGPTRGGFCRRKHEHEHGAGDRDVGGCGVSGVARGWWQRWWRRKSCCWSRRRLQHTLPLPPWPLPLLHWIPICTAHGRASVRRLTPPPLPAPR